MCDRVVSRLWASGPSIFERAITLEVMEISRCGKKHVVLQ